MSRNQLERGLKRAKIAMSCILGLFMILSFLPVAIRGSESQIKVYFVVWISIIVFLILLFRYFSKNIEAYISEENGKESNNAVSFKTVTGGWRKLVIATVVLSSISIATLIILSALFV